MSISAPVQRIAELMARKTQYNIKANNSVITHLQQNADSYQGALAALKVDAFRLLNDNGAASKLGVKNGLAYLRVKPQHGPKLDRIYFLKERTPEATVAQNQRIHSEVQNAINKTEEAQRAHTAALLARGQQPGMPGRLHRPGQIQAPAVPQVPAQNRNNIFASQPRAQHRNFNVSDYNAGFPESEALFLVKEQSKETFDLREAAECISQAQRIARQKEFNGAFNEAEGIRRMLSESLRTNTNAPGAVVNDITPREWEQIRQSEARIAAEADPFNLFGEDTHLPGAIRL